MTDSRFEPRTVVVPTGSIYPNGALVVVGYDAAGNLLAHPPGGGFQFSIRPDQARQLRVVTDQERLQPLYRKTTFGMEGIEATFEGWTDGTLWNGWARPLFEFAAAAEVAQVFGGEYRADLDAFVTKPDDGEEEVWQSVMISTPGGVQVKLYPIGAAAWIWDEVTV